MTYPTKGPPGLRSLPWRHRRANGCKLCGGITGATIMGQRFCSSICKEGVTHPRSRVDRCVCGLTIPNRGRPRTVCDACKEPGSVGYRARTWVSMQLRGSGALDDDLADLIGDVVRLYRTALEMGRG